MNQKLDEAVQEVEKRFIHENKSFTSLDVGNELKEQGVNVRQREVSPIVREHFKGDLYDGTGFTRTLIPVRHGNESAFLYLHIDSDPNEYSTTNQETVPWDPNKPMFPEDSAIAGKITPQQSVTPTAVQTTPAATNTTPTTTATLDNIVASKNSGIYHYKDCMYASRIMQENLVTFQDATEAAKDNYRKCMRE